MKWKTALLRLLWRWGVWRPYEGVPRSIWEHTTRWPGDCSYVDVTSSSDAAARRRVFRIEAPTLSRAAGIMGRIMPEAGLLGGASLEPWPGEHGGLWRMTLRCAPPLPEPPPIEIIRDDQITPGDRVYWDSEGKLVKGEAS